MHGLHPKDLAKVLDALRPREANFIRLAALSLDGLSGDEQLAQIAVETPLRGEGVGE